MIASKCVDLQGRKMNLKIPSSVVGPSAFRCLPRGLPSHDISLGLAIWPLAWLSSLCFTKRNAHQKEGQKCSQQFIAYGRCVMVYVYGSCLYCWFCCRFFLESFWVRFTLIPGAAGHQSWLVHLSEDILCRGGVADGQVALHWVESSFSGNGNSMRLNELKFNEVEWSREMLGNGTDRFKKMKTVFQQVTTAWTPIKVRQGGTQQYYVHRRVVAIPTARHGRVSKRYHKSYFCWQTFPSFTSAFHQCVVADHIRQWLLLHLFKDI